jgi:hypothetical protein
MDNLVKKILYKQDDQFDKDLIKELKRLCKSDPTNISLAHRAIMNNMQKPHSQLRLAGLELMDQLFPKSYQFQTLVIKSGLWLMDLCLGTLEEPLPPPEKWAAKLERKVVLVIKEWVKNHHAAHPELPLLLEQLNRLVLDRSWIDQRDHFQNSAADLRLERSKALRLEKYLKYLEADYQTQFETIRDHIHQLESSMNILVPDLQKGLESHSSADPYQSYNPALHPSNMEITIRPEYVLETEENSILFDAVRENRAVLLKHQAQVDELLSMASKVDDPDKPRHEQFLKDCIDVKVKLLDILAKSRDLLDHSMMEIDSDENEEFEEIQVEGTVSTVQQKVKQQHTVIPIKSFTGLSGVFKSREGEEDDPTVGKRTVVNQEEEQNHSVPSHLKEYFEKAPVVEFDQDLEYWGKNNLTFADVSKHSGLEFKHRFLGEGSSEKELSESTIEGLKKRVVVLPPKVSQVEYPPCRAPLRDGTLCKRRDMERCPFHGLIQPRDEEGKLISGEDETKMIPIWQQIESQVSFAVGNSIERKKKKRRLLDEIPKEKPSVKKRLLGLSKRMAKRNVNEITPEQLSERDRKVFRW